MYGRAHGILETKKSADIGFFIYRRSLLSDSSVPGDGFPSVRLFCNAGFILGNNDLGGTVGAGKGLSHRGKANRALRAAESVSGVCGHGEAVHSGNFAVGPVSGGAVAPAEKMAADCRLYRAGISDCISVSGAECADFRLAVLSLHVFGLVSGRLESFQRLCGQRCKGNPGICAGDLRRLSAGSAVEAVAAKLVCSAGWIR